MLIGLVQLLTLQIRLAQILMNVFALNFRDKVVSAHPTSNALLLCTLLLSLSALLSDLCLGTQGLARALTFSILESPGSRWLILTLIVILILREVLCSFQAGRLKILPQRLLLLFDSVLSYASALLIRQLEPLEIPILVKILIPSTNPLPLASLQRAIQQTLPTRLLRLAFICFPQLLFELIRLTLVVF